MFMHTVTIPFVHVCVYERHHGQLHEYTHLSIGKRKIEKTKRRSLLKDYYIDIASVAIQGP